LAGFGTLRRFAPCPSGHITADKRKIKDFPKLPSATSFIRKTLYEIVLEYFDGGKKYG